MAARRSCFISELGRQGQKVSRLASCYTGLLEDAYLKMYMRGCILNAFEIPYVFLPKAASLARSSKGLAYLF